MVTDRSRDDSTDDLLRSATLRLRDLAGEVDERLPRRIALLDQLIATGNREIARLQRTLAIDRSTELTDFCAGSRRPDVIVGEDANREIILPLVQPTPAPARRRAA